MADMLTGGAETAAAMLHGIFLHGRGRDPAEMLRLAQSLDAPDLRAHCPVAPGGSWYPAPFMAGLDLNRGALDAALAQLGRVVDGLLAQGVPPRAILLCGFSQGACVVVEYLSRHPLRFGGALVFSGGLVGPEGTVWPVQGSFEGMPVLLTGSDDDVHVPAFRLAETRHMLEAMGADVRLAVYPDRPHVVSPAEILLARELLGDARAALGEVEYRSRSAGRGG